MKLNVTIRIGITVFYLFASASCFSQIDTAIIKFKNTLSVSTTKGYSDAVVIDLGNCQMIILSGQVPLDSNGILVGKGNLTKQTEQIFLNIQNIILELGGTMNNVIKLGVYMTDVSQIQNFRDIRDKFINNKNPPTSTLVQVNKLF